MKTIYEQLEEEEKAIEGEETTETVEDPLEEETTEEVPAEPDKPVEPPVENTAETMAALRFQASEAKRQVREANENAQRAIELSKPKPIEDVEPNKAEDREEWLEWKARQLEKSTQELTAWKTEQDRARQYNETLDGASRELQSYEARFAQQQPEYNEAASFVAQRVAQSIALLNPGLSQDQVNDTTRRQLLSMASGYVNQGLDPAAAFFGLAKQSGFVKAEPVEEPKPAPKTPSLDTIEKNKKKSANGLNGSGGKGTITAEALQKMSVKELDAMDPDEINSILYG